MVNRQIQEHALADLDRWFGEYTARFTSGNPLTKRNLEMKTAHTRRVAQKCRAIAESLALPEEQCLLAEILGLFHDVGRFPQFTQYGTFRDALSRDHAVMSVEALDAEGVWRDFSSTERQLLTDAILYHNRFAIPAECTGDTLLFAQIIRDADKLDNLQIDAEGKRRNYTITLNAQGDGDTLHAAETVSPAVREAILQHRCVRYAEVQTLCDLSLIMVGAIYDLNFPYAFHEVRDGAYVERIFSWLPQNSLFAEMQEAVLAYVDAKDGVCPG